MLNMFKESLIVCKENTYIFVSHFIFSGDKICKMLDDKLREYVDEYGKLI